MAFKTEIPLGKESAKGSTGGISETNKLLKKLDKSVLATVDVNELITSLFGDVIKMLRPLIKILSILFLIIFMPLMPIIKLLMKGLAGLIKIFQGDFGDIAKFIGKVVLGLLLLVLAAVTGPVWLVIGLIIGAVLLLGDAFGMLIEFIVWSGKKIFEGHMWVWENLLKPGFLLIWEGIKWFHNLWISSWLGIFKVIKNFGLWIWDFFLAGLDFIKDLGSMLWNWFKTALKGIANLGSLIWDYIKSSIGFGGGKSSDGAINDGIVQNGKIITTHPEDTIMAFKDPGIFGKGGNTININNPVVRDDRDIKKITEQVSRALQSRANRSFS